HKAKQIIFDYDDDGRVSALLFSLEISGRVHGFKMPARTQHVKRLLYPKGTLTQTQKEQAYRTAWANIRAMMRRLKSSHRMVHLGPILPTVVAHSRATFDRCMSFDGVAPLRVAIVLFFTFHLDTNIYRPLAAFG